MPRLTSFPRARRARLAGSGALLSLALAAVSAAPAAAAVPVSFGKGTLAGASSVRPTSLQWGPDNRLYAANQDGVIKAYTVTRAERVGDAKTGTYSVSDTETIDLVNKMPNRNDDGALNAGVKGRLVTGIVVTGTAAQPVIYVASSDPRIGGGADKVNDLNLDTNSGILSKLTKSGGSWTKQDLVRGLPRSEENHTANGLALSPNGQTLYIAQGGNTNDGAPSNNFALLPEYALSAAILSVDLTAPAVAGGPYDLPTLDDETRPGSPDVHDPFGGNDGKNQAKLLPGGPVQVHAPGFRNPYDVLVTATGNMFSVDNGGNSGWGDVPAGEGTAGTCTNAQQEPGVSGRDSLHAITAKGYYGGHPNPTRANPANTFNSSNPQSPVSAGNAVECDHRSSGNSTGAGKADGSLTSFDQSTNGLAEYTASNFEGAMKGNLLAASFDNTIQRVVLTGPSSATKSPVASAVGKYPLDVTTVGDTGAFPGTIWVADVGTSALYVLEPSDFGGLEPPACNPEAADSDGDGYSNTDEAINKTDPCSAAAKPADSDDDKVSDRLDDNDDNDALADKVDPFAIDSQNGLNRSIPLLYGWENEASDDIGGFFGLGFTGLMTNGITDYLDQFDPAKMTTGGAAGVVTIDEVDPGEAYSDPDPHSTIERNSQKYGFQFGINARPAEGPFTVRTRIVGPFQGLKPQNFQSMGLFIGTGDQDNYVKITTAMINGTGVQVVKEVGAKVSNAAMVKSPMPGPEYVDLFLAVDPQAGTVQPSFVASTNGVDSERQNVGGKVFIPTSWFTAPDRGLAVGIISTSVGPGPPFPASWDLMEVTRGMPSSQGANPPTVPTPPPTDGPSTDTPPAPPNVPVVPRPPLPPAPPLPPGPEPQPRDVLSPRISGLRLNAKSFATVTRRGRKPGTTLRLTLSEAASVELRIYRRTTGRRVGGRCVKTTRSNRNSRTCVREVRVRGTIAKRMAAGAGTVRITGRVGGRRLAAGSYRVAVLATDAAGNRTTVRGVLMRIVR